MNEEEDKKPEGEKETANDNAEGDKSKTPKSIIDANAAAERLEKANTKHAENLDRQEDMISRKILGGVADAGTETTPQFTDEEKASRARIKAVADASGSAWGKNYE